MQLFLKKTAQYFAIVYLSFLIILFLSSAFAKEKASKRGRGIVIDKMMLLRKTTSPKIILIGGSNVCYGINAQLIEDSLHLPVIDMSINADVGMVFYMNQIKPYIKKGDIIISIPEYASYSDKLIYGNESLYGLCTIMPENCKILTAYQWFRAVTFGGDILKDNYTAIVSDKNAPISSGRKLYNKWGNYIGHQNKLTKIDTIIAAKTATTNLIACDNYYKEVRLFNKFCTEKGANYLHSFPVFMRCLYKPEWEKSIKQNLYNITIINTPTEYLYNSDSLYDSENHLRFQYRDDRTIKLINNLKASVYSKN